MNKRYYFIWSVLLTFTAMTGLLISCSEDSDCSMTARPFAVCNFYKYGANKDIVINDTLKFLTVKAIGTDSILFNRGEKVSTVDIPLRYTNDTTGIILNFEDPDSSGNKDKKNDTIWIKHKSTPFFVSVECGYEVRQEIETILKHTKHKIDSVAIRNKEANNYGKENIKIIL